MHQAMCAFVGAETVEIVLGHPAQRERLLVRHLDRTERRDDQEAEVEMQMGHLARWLNPVNVDVDRRHRDVQAGQTRFPRPPPAGQHEPGWHHRRRARRAGTSGRACGAASATCCCPTESTTSPEPVRCPSAQRRSRASVWAATKASTVGDALLRPLPRPALLRSAARATPSPSTAATSDDRPAGLERQRLGLGTVHEISAQTRSGRRERTTAIASRCRR